MQFDKRHRLHRACADPEGDRPALEHIWFERIGPDECLLSAESYARRPWNAVAVAADGFILAVVPVLLEEGEDDGPLPAFAWKDGRGCVRRGEHTRAVESVREHEPPPWRRLLTLAFPDGRARRSTSKPVTLNVGLLARLGEAIGTHPSLGNAWHRTTLRLGANPSKPILVESAPRDAGGRLIPPFGLLMPMLGEFPRAERAPEVA